MDIPWFSRLSASWEATGGRSRARDRPLRPLAVPGAYLLIALALAWPLPRHFATHVPSGGDALLFLWNLWWFRQAAESGSSPFQTTLLYHPHGTSLVFTTLAPLPGALSAPLQWAGLNLVACYNLLLLLGTVAAAWAMWALARHATGSAAAAFVAGLIYGWAPYHSARIAAGHLNLASHQWLPLYALALLRLVDAVWPGAHEEGWRAAPGVSEGVWRPSRRALPWAILAAVAAAATAWTEYTYAAFLALWTAFYLAYRGWPFIRRRDWRPLRDALGPLATVGGLALLLVAPLLLAAAREILRDRSGYIYSHPLETLIYSSDAVAYLLPSELHPWAGARLLALGDRIGGTPVRAERVVTLGWTAPLLGLLALGLGRRRRAVRFWAWATALAALLSIGPVLHILGDTTFTAFHSAVLLPYALLYELPGFSVMRSPLRFAVLVALGGAVLAAYGLTALRARWPRVGHVAAILAALLVIAEFWPALPLIPAGPSATAAALRRDPAPGAVVTLPLAPRVDDLWLQTQHGRPIVGGYLARQPPDPFAAENPAMRYLDPATPAGADGFVRDGAGRRALQEAGVRYVVVRWWAAPREELGPLVQKLGVVFGEQRAIEVPQDQTSYYLVPPPL